MKWFQTNMCRDFDKNGTISYGPKRPKILRTENIHDTMYYDSTIPLDVASHCMRRIYYIINCDA